MYKYHLHILPLALDQEHILPYLKMVFLSDQHEHAHRPQDQNHIFRIRYGEPSYTAYNIAYNGLIKGDVDFEYKYDFKFLEIVQNPVIENEDNNIDDVSNNDDSIDKSIHNEEDGGSSSYNDDYSENSSCNRYISWTKKLILLPFL